ncbi:MAG: purine-binding chemotaxis protein CheW [Desulfobacteraceae bacterium]|nr:purine-binding chemotaxis protein CheW [Desulfobacteraceae bacterium]
MSVSQKTGGILEKSGTQHDIPETLIPVGDLQGQKKLQESLSIITDREGKYLTFTLDGEEYGIGILKIKEIIGMMPITSVPRTPGYVKGVINLRGKVIPIVDLRLRFNMQSIEYTDRTCIIVVEIEGQDITCTIGIVVDSVSEVLNFKNEEIENTPSFGTNLNTRYILGMAKMEGKVKILLDIDEVLQTSDFATIAEPA